MGPPDTKESLFHLQTLPCLGVGRGQAVCYRKGAGLAGGRTSNLPWPPQDTLYFATMTARRGVGHAERTASERTSGTRARRPVHLSCAQNPGSLHGNEQRGGEAVCEVSAPWSRGNARRGTWKLQDDLVLSHRSGGPC